MDTKKLIIIAAIALVVIIAVVAVLFLFVFNDSGEPKEEEIIYKEYKFDETYSNTADSAIVKHIIVIQYTGDETLAVIEKNKTELVNNIDEIFRGKTAEDLKGRVGKVRCREQIRQMIIEAIESDEKTITNVFFTTFLVQG